MLESLFKRTTDITLLELTDYNHPLLRRMQLEAPGTYHHSLVVAQLAADGVVVSITVGRNLNRGLGNDDDDDAGFERDRSSPTAGWTVLCNDRAVIVGDKTRLTGWGDGIPLYHPQFAIITGIIEFRSKRADKLPVTMQAIRPGLIETGMTKPTFDYARARGTGDKLGQLNPLLRYDGFEPKAAGIRALLPHAKAMIPVHDLRSLADIAQAVERQRSATMRKPRRAH